MSDIHIDHLQIDNFIQGNGNIVGNNTYNTVSISSEASAQIQYCNPKMISDLLNALNGIQVAAQSLPGRYQEQAKEHINEIEKELHEEKPRFGRLRAAYDALRRLVTNESFLRAVEVFGGLLLKK